LSLCVTSSASSSRFTRFMPASVCCRDTGEGAGGIADRN
jgi:hypothetical protein